MTPEEEEHLDEVLGRTRCARCGQILRGEIDCPVCSGFPDPPAPRHTPMWVYLTAGLLAIVMIWIFIFWL